MLEKVQSTLGAGWLLLWSLSEDTRRSGICDRSSHRNVEYPTAIAQASACARTQRAATETVVQTDGVPAFAHNELFQQRSTSATRDVTPNRFH